MSYPRIAETDDVCFQPLEVGREQLTLSGLLFHSAIVVERVQIIEADDTARILVEMATTRDGKSGSFKVAIPLTDHTKRITFGLSDKEIWSRAYRFQ